jgi:hypothetical protein
MLDSLIKKKKSSFDESLNSDDVNWQQKEKDPIVKGCFIATAAMDSELHPYVQSLRDFRDNILLKSRYKNTFENLLEKYYVFSPPIARYMKKNRLIKLILKYILVYPIVFGIKIVLPIFNIVLGIEKDTILKNKLNN